MQNIHYKKILKLILTIKLMPLNVQRQRIIEDDVIIKKTILLNIKTFKLLCLKSDTKKQMKYMNILLV